MLVDGSMRAAGPNAEVYARPPYRTTAELLGYAVIRTGRRTISVPAGAWVLGNGDATIELVVERVVDMGNHLHAVGVWTACEWIFDSALTTAFPRMATGYAARRGRRYRWADGGGQT